MIREFQIMLLHWVIHSCSSHAAALQILLTFGQVSSISRLKASMQYKNQVNFIEVVCGVTYWHLAVQQYFVKLHEA